MPWAISTKGDSMKNTTQVYVLTLNAPSRKTVRLWTGASVQSCGTAPARKLIVRWRRCSNMWMICSAPSACWRRADPIPSIALGNVPQQ